MIWLLGGYMWLFIHRPFEVWPWLGDLQIERVYMLLMIAYWAVQPNKGWLPNRLHGALVVFTVVMTAAWAAGPYMSYPDCKDLVEDYYKYLVFYILVVTSVRDEASLRKLFLLYLAAVAVYTGHSLVEYMNGRHSYRMDVARLIGVSTSLGDANGFAANLVYALPLTLPFWLTRPNVWMKAALVGFTLMACVGILLTGSRTGFLGLGLCTLLCLGASRRFKTALALTVAGVMAAPVVWMALPADLQARYTTIIDPSVGPANAQESAEGRVDGVVLGVAAWQQSPILGYGPNGFMHAMHRPIGTHNLYAQALSETGTLGALALAGLLWCYWLNVREANRFHRLDPQQPRTFAFYAVRAIGVCVLMLLFHGMAGHNLLRFYWVWFAAFQAVALHCVRRRAAVPAWDVVETGQTAAGLA